MNAIVTRIANYVAQVAAQLALRGYAADVAQLDCEDSSDKWNLILIVNPQDQSLQDDRVVFVLDVAPLNALGTRADITINEVSFSGVTDRERRGQLNNAARYSLYEEVIYNGDDEDYFVDDLSGEVCSNGIPVERVVNGLVKAAEVSISAEDEL